LYFSSASLQQAKEHTEALEAKLKLTEEALEKAQTDAASIEELRQHLHKAETSLSDNITEQIAREKALYIGLKPKAGASSVSYFLCLKALRVLSSWLTMTTYFATAGRNEERFELLEPKNDHLLDALSILELQGDLARTNLDESRPPLSRIFPHLFSKET
jgi:hypothetical protein